MHAVPDAAREHVPLAVEAIAKTIFISLFIIGNGFSLTYRQYFFISARMSISLDRLSTFSDIRECIDPLSPLRRAYMIRASRALDKACCDDGFCVLQCGGGNCPVILQSCEFEHAEERLIEFIEGIRQVETIDMPLQLYRHLLLAGYDADIISEDGDVRITIRGSMMEQAYVSGIIEQLIKVFATVSDMKMGHASTTVVSDTKLTVVESRIIFTHIDQMRDGG